MTTPLAPTPAPAPAPVAAPAPDAVQTPLRDALTAARAAEAPATTPEAPAPVIDETGRAHDAQTGKFIPKPGEPGYVEPKGAPGEAGAVGEGAEGEAPAPGEGEQPEGAEGEGTHGEEGGEPDPALTVAIPGRRPGETVELAAPDAETAEELRRLSNGYMAGEEVRTMKAAVEQNQQALDQVHEYIETDPVGFVLENLPAEMQDEIALQMLARPEVFERVAGVLEKMMDGRERELIVAKLENRRFTMQEQLRASRTEKQMARENANEVRSVISSLVPDGYTPDQTADFMRQCLNDVSQFASVNRLRKVDPKMVPALLAARLSDLGLDPVQAAARAAQQRLRTPGTPANGSANGTGARPSAPAPAAPKRVTAQTFIQGQERRKAVAAVPPAGAGTPPVGVPAPPPGANLKEASAHLRSLIRR